MNIYACNYRWIIGIIVFSAIGWNVAAYCINEKIWKILNGIGAIIALGLILFHTVIGREATAQHVFILMSSYSNEFWREMIMNLFLYFPLGLTLSVLIGWRDALIGFLMALSIETWQYAFGTGTAQGTDVLCNTLGVAIGNLGCLWKKVTGRKRI